MGEKCYDRFYMRIVKFKDSCGKDRWLMMWIEKNIYDDIWVQFRLTISELPDKFQDKKTASELLYRIHISKKRRAYEIRTWWHTINTDSSYAFILNDKMLKIYAEFFQLCGLDIDVKSLKEIINKVKFIYKL